MAIIIHQAICGEQNKAWDLLRTTLPDNATAKKIAFKTDLQDSPPSGVTWLPVVRGFLFNEYYLLIKTYPDTSQDVRNGRVFSHCLIIAKDDLAKISDLSELFSLFKNEIDKSISLEPITVKSQSEKQITISETVKSRFNKAVQGFLGLAKNDNTIIWVGQENYENVVSRFWQLLSTGQKEIFNFGICFNTAELPKEKINFVAIPESIEAKFDNKGYCIIRKSDSIILTEFSEQFLAGEDNATTRLKAFTQAFEFVEFSTNEISTIAKGVATFENLKATTDLKLLNTLSNIVAKYSHDDKKGAASKNQLIERISIVTETADEKDIYLLKNFPTKSFKDSEKKISQSVKKWITDFLFSEKQNLKKDFVPLVNQVNSTSSSNWLTKLFHEKLKDFLSSINQGSAAIIWKWIATDVNILKYISSELEGSKKAEEFFTDNYKTLESSILKVVKSFAAKRNWLKLYATILKSEFDFETAIEEQLKVDTDANYSEAIEVITKGVKPKDIIDSTILNGDSRCISISGKLCRTDSTLLEKLQVENRNWQEVWFTAINIGNKITDGIKEPKKIIHKLFDTLVSGKAVNENLLEKISETDFANILEYQHREKIWARLPIRVRNKFLGKTASSLLEALSKNSTVQIPADRELSNYIISNAISTFLFYNKSNFKTTLPIFNTFSQLPEHILRDYVSNYSGKLDVDDATQLGKIVLQRRYTGIAYTINSKISDDKMFKFALAECYSLLDFFTQGFIKLTGTISNVSVTEAQWWTAFSELSYKLYSCLLYTSDAADE